MKGAELLKKSALIEKRYHNQLKRCQNERYIPGIQSMYNIKITGRRRRRRKRRGLGPVN